MPIFEALDRVDPGLLIRLQTALQNQHLSARTEQQYRHWITRFMLFHGMPATAALGQAEKQQFLAFVEREAALSRARMNIVRQAIDLFYDQFESVSSKTTSQRRIAS